MTISSRAARRALAVLALALLAGCASIPPIDRELLRTERIAPTAVQLHGAHGVLSHAQSRKILDNLEKRSPHTSLFDHHVAIEQALAGTPLSVGNKVTLLEDSKATYGAMLAAIKAAKHHVHLEVYIFEGGDVGRAFADALIERRRAGVEVRVIYDSVGSIDTPKQFFDDMKSSGIEVLEYNPVSAAALLAKGLALDHRDHRKLMVVDGRLAFLGGINISKVYGALGSGPGGSSSSGGSGGSGGSGAGATTGRTPMTDRPFAERPWRDTQVRIDGPAVAEFQRIFLEQWAHLKKEAPATDRGYFPPLKNEGEQVVRAIAGRPEDGANALYVTLISAIDSAETDIQITNAYFVPHQDLLSALEEAAQRGVDVKLVLPSRTDNWVVMSARRSYYGELLEAGVKIYERKTRLLHARTATIDGVWSTVGSTNLDWRSLIHNDELNAVILGPDFAAQMNRVFQGDLSHSTEITRAAWSHRPISDRVREWSARAWARLL